MGSVEYVKDSSSDNAESKDGEWDQRERNMEWLGFATNKGIEVSQERGHAKRDDEAKEKNKRKSRQKSKPDSQRRQILG